MIVYEKMSGSFHLLTASAVPRPRKKSRCEKFSELN
nr:MAG TPA: hypothetical protein [Caudoviricetes sp.]